MKKSVVIKNREGNTQNGECPPSHLFLSCSAFANSAAPLKARFMRSVCGLRRPRASSVGETPVRVFLQAVGILG